MQHKSSVLAPRHPPIELSQATATPMSPTTSTNPGPNTASRDSATMLAAIAILAYAASLMTHEALGHGGYCLAARGAISCSHPGKKAAISQGQPN